MPQPQRNDQQTRQTEVRQTDENCSDENYARRLGAFAIQGGETRHDENRISKPICQRRDSNRHTDTEQGTIIGGILSQLIAEHDDQLADYRSKIEKLEQRRHQLVALYEQLQVETGEDEEDEVERRKEEE